MQLLVVGANGPLGSNVVRAGQQCGWNVSGVYHSTRPAFDIPLTQFDLREYNSFGDVLAEYDPDVVVNCAAMTDVDGCEANPERAHGVPQYLLYDKQYPTTPVSPYGASKLAAERYACSYGEVYEFPIVALRYFTVYDPQMRPNMAISNFVSRCLNDRSPVVYGDGTKTRDFTFIDDILEANVTLLNEDAADGEALNIGSTDSVDILTLAEEIRDQTAPDTDIEFDERHDADAKHTHLDISKASEMLGYEPTRTIREGVAEFVDWYRAHRDWYEPLVLEN